MLRKDEQLTLAWHDPIQTQMVPHTAYKGQAAPPTKQSQHPPQDNTSQVGMRKSTRRASEKSVESCVDPLPTGQKIREAKDQRNMRPGNFVVSKHPCDSLSHHGLRQMRCSGCGCHLWHPKHHRRTDKTCVTSGFREVWVNWHRGAAHRLYRRGCAQVLVRPV